MIRTLTSVLLLALVCPLHAVAIELLPGAELHFELSASAAWDDNFSNQDRWDLAAEIMPSVRLIDTEGRFTYSFRYRPNYEGILRINGANSWDHSVEGNAAYQLTPRTSLFARANFSRPESISSRRQQIFDIEPGEEAEAGQATEESPNIQFGTERRKRWSYTAGLQHTLTPRSTLVLSGTQSESRRSDPGATGSLVRSLLGQWSYVLTESDTVGSFVQWSKSSFGSDTNRLLSQLTWTHRFDSTFQFSFNIGPQWARPDEPVRTLHAQVLQYPFALDQNNDPILRDTPGCDEVDGIPVLSLTCGTIFLGPVSDRFNPSPTGAFPGTGPVVDAEDEILPQQIVEVPIVGTLRPGSAKTTSDLIWSLNFRKTWQEWNLRGAISRSEAGSETLGSSVKSTSANLRLGWKPTRLWDISLRGGWRRSETRGSTLVPRIALRRSNIDTELLGLEDFGALNNVLRDISTRAPIPVAEAYGLVFQKINTRRRFDVFQAGLRFQRKISDALTTTLSVGYRIRRQKSRAAGIGTRAENIQNSRVTLGFTYRFDPIKL